ncbi:TLD family protein [Acanthocheilonema viteae]
MSGDHSSPAMRSFRRSNLGKLYQSFIKRRKSTSTEEMADAHATATEARDKEQAPFFTLPAISIMTSMADVEDGEAGLGRTELSTTSILPAPLQCTESNRSFFSRLSGRLRRSLHFPSNKRKRSVKFIASNEVAVNENVRPLLLHESGEETFTDYASIKIVNYGESYGDIKLIRQILHRNKTDEIKKLLRKKNWPVGHGIRANLWQEICKINNPDFNAYKDSYESEAWEEHIGHFSPKARFLLSSDAIHNCYELNGNGLKALHRLISALDATVPTLNYAPLVQPILALFLHYMSEDDAYACVFWILKNHSNYMKRSAQASKATSYTLLALVKIYKTAVYKTLRNWIGSSDANILAKALQNWPRWIFCALPFEHLICVIDCYLYEGSKVLMRIAIALLSIWHKSVKIPDDLVDKTCQERIDLFAEGIVQIVNDKNISTAALFETAIRIRNFSSAKIVRFQERYEKMILQLEGPDLAMVDLPAVHIKPFISTIVSSEVAFQLMCCLPEKYQLITPMLIYHLCEDGTSFYRLWAKIDEAKSTLLIIKTDKSEVLGAFCDEPWGNRTKTCERGSKKYFGSGLSFVWNLDENNQVNKYDWKENQAECFMAAPYDREPTILMIGGNAIHIVDELIKGSSLPGNTFGNPELVKGGIFKIHDMEVI